MVKLYSLIAVVAMAIVFAVAATQSARQAERRQAVIEDHENAQKARSLAERAINSVVGVDPDELLRNTGGLRDAE